MNSLLTFIAGIVAGALGVIAWAEFSIRSDKSRIFSAIINGNLITTDGAVLVFSLPNMRWYRALSGMYIKVRYEDLISGWAIPCDALLTTKAGLAADVKAWATLDNFEAVQAFLKAECGEVHMIKRV